MISTTDKFAALVKIVPDLSAHARTCPARPRITMGGPVRLNARCNCGCTEHSADTQSEGVVNDDSCRVVPKPQP